MPFLRVDGLTYTYPGTGTPALRGADLVAERGEMVAVVGPNAAGKSTLARLLKGLLEPQGGAVSITGGPRVSGGPDRRVGLVFSNPENAVISSLVEEDIAFGLEMLAVDPPAIRARVREVMESLGIASLRGRMPHRLSGGELQMVALAGAIAAGPDILVLDEPTAFIDPPGRLRVMAALRKQCGEGRTVILVTHDMEQAAQCSSVAVLVEGKTLVQDRPERIFSETGLLHAARLRQPFDFTLREALLLSKKTGGEPLPSGGDGGLMDWLLGRGGPAGGPVAPHRAESAGLASRDILTFRDVRFAYGAGPSDGLLSGVDLAAVKGALTVLCGPNGSGKSTLLQMANGLLVPDSGEVCLGSEPLSSAGRRPGGLAARVGLLFQSPERQVFAQTVFDDAAFGPRNLGWDEDAVRRAVHAAMEKVDLPAQLVSRSPWTLSGGQLRRLAVAGVLAMGPEVLVMDEPTDGLDPAGCERLWGSLRDLAADGVSVLAATHQVPDDLTGVPRLALLEGGKIAQCGHPRSLLRAAGGGLLSLSPPHVRAQARLAAGGLPLSRPGLSVAETVEAIVDALP